MKDAIEVDFDLEKPKILMVDDRPENLLVLERLLRDFPVDLYKASSGNEALRLTLHHDFALALLDIQMPEMDGYELAELLRQEEKTAKMPFIFISAIYTEHINIFHGYEKGAFSYIVKPFEPEVLLSKVKLFINMHQDAQKLQRRSEELEQANKELEAFSYSVSHDLRAPLRAIDGFSQILLEDYYDVLDEEGRDHLTRVRTGAQHMAQLIDELLKLAQVSRQELHFEPVDLSEIVSGIWQNLLSQEPNHPAEINIEPNLVRLCDPGTIQIALHNLLHNAWKYSSKKSKIKIEFGNVDDETRDTLFVRDNGAGFDMKYSDKLFGAFQRLHKQSDFPGTGVGLATVMRIISRHHGSVWAQATPDVGATFYFTLPCVQQANHTNRGST